MPPHMRIPKLGYQLSGLLNRGLTERRAVLNHEPPYFGYAHLECETIDTIFEK